MSMGLDLDRTGSGLCRILLNLDWIRAVNCFINLGSRPDLDRVNGKKCVIFLSQKVHFVKFLDFIWTWTFNFKKVSTAVGLGQSFEKSGLDLDRKIWQSVHLWSRPARAL